MRALFLCAFTMCSLVCAADVGTALVPQSTRKPAPEFTLIDAFGQSVSLSKFRGSPMIVDLWATKCGGCVKEIPSFIDINHKYSAKGLTVVGISMDILYEDLKGPTEAWALVKPFVRSHAVDYPILMGDDGITKRYSVEALPVTYLLDSRGRIAAKYVGVVDSANLDANVRALLAER